jgi:ribosomal protein S25
MQNVVLLERVRENFTVNFPGSQFQAQQASIHKPINKDTSTRLLLDKKPARKCCVLTEEKLDKIRAKLEHTSQKSLRHLAQETGILKSSAAKAMKW